MREKTHETFSKFFANHWPFDEPLAGRTHSLRDPLYQVRGIVIHSHNANLALNLNLKQVKLICSEVFAISQRTANINTSSHLYIDFRLSYPKLSAS